MALLTLLLIDSNSFYLPIFDSTTYMLFHSTIDWLSYFYWLFLTQLFMAFLTLLLIDSNTFYLPIFDSTTYRLFDSTIDWLYYFLFTIFNTTIYSLFYSTIFESTIYFLFDSTIDWLHYFFLDYFWLHYLLTFRTLLLISPSTCWLFLALF